MDISVISAWVLLILGAGVLTLLSYWFKYRGIPPGPRGKGLPLVGYVPFFGLNPQDTFLKLGKVYGGLFSMSMGPQLTIVLNDYEAIQAAFSGQAEVFSGRADGFVFRKISEGNDGKFHGISFQNGDISKTGRRFMMQTFRDLGVGKSKLQDQILEEAEYLNDIFANHEGRPFNPFRTLFLSVSNVVCTLCFGRRFDHEDPEFLKHLAGVEFEAVMVAQAGALQAYPVLRFLPGHFRRMWNQIETTAATSRKYLKTHVKAHRQSLAGAEVRDYIDAFLKQQKTEKAALGGIRPAFQDEELFQNIRAFFSAGTETTASTLQWGLLFMLYHPDVQRKIHQELDDNIGKENSVRIEDKVKVPYLEAVIREVQRLANVIPFGLLRTNLEETTLLGYRIPKRCYIMPNYLAVNVDPKLWKDPLNFNPDRFLDANGKVHEPPHFMPFAIGKRSCVGEGLARMELFLIFANILQRFEIRLPKGRDLPPEIQYTTGISCRPLPFEIQAIPRHPTI